jgi:hypothetical protein
MKLLLMQRNRDILMSDKFKEEIEEFYKRSADFGKEPLAEPLTDVERKQATLAMAVNAALIQFVLEGLLSPADQLHFMVHVSDFSERLYKGEEIKFPGAEQTMSVNSRAGWLYNAATDESFRNGSKSLADFKAAIAEYEAKQQTNKDEENGIVPAKYTVH